MCMWFSNFFENAFVKAAHLHTPGEALALDMRRADERRIEITFVRVYFAPVQAAGL